ncbi:MAG: hypothetical protein JSR46_01500, partial [Verrucomicrobia bacterium]|nr:hypothetical protein [Verrucomicrobiota bacterium]
ALFNEVLEFQISTKLPYALQIMCYLMNNLSTKNVLFVRDDDLKIAALETIINACLAMPNARASSSTPVVSLSPALEKRLITAGSSTLLRLIDNVNQESAKSVPLLECLIDCLLGPKRQLITYDNKDVALKGYPIIKRLTDALIALCTQEGDNPEISFDECVGVLFNLWKRVWKHDVYESELQHAELLKLCMSTTILQKICAHEAWETHVTAYYNLIVYPGASDSRPLLDLFREFIMELLKSDKQHICDKGKALFIEGTKKGMYPGKLVEDQELWNLFKREASTPNKPE